jgi:hypothetical protein
MEDPAGRSQTARFLKDIPKWLVLIAFMLIASYVLWFIAALLIQFVLAIGWRTLNPDSFLTGTSPSLDEGSMGDAIRGLALIAVVTFWIWLYRRPQRK